MTTFRGELVTRYDIGALSPPVETAEGFLRVQGYASRTGIFEYMNPDGSTRRELRLPEEVFSPGSLASYEGKPMTVRHPPGLVTPQNAKRYMVGTLLRPGVQDGDHIAIDAIITDENAIALLRSRKIQQLSSGYRLLLDKTPGQHPQWGDYHAIQREIDVNHLAMLELGRAGPTAAVKLDALAARRDRRRAIGRGFATPADEIFRFDATAAVMVSSAANHTTCSPVIDRVTGGEHTHLKGTMADKKQDPKPDPKPAPKPAPNEKGLLEAAAAEVAREKARADAAEQKLVEESKRADTAEGALLGSQQELADLKAIHIDQGKIDELTAKIDTLELELAEATDALAEAKKPDVIQAAVKARLDIEKVAIAVLDRADLADLDDHTVMALVIEKRGGTVDPKHSVDHVRGQFDALTKAWSKGAEAMARLRVAATPVNRDGTAPAVKKTARDEYIERQQNAWKTAPGIASIAMWSTAAKEGA